MENALGWGKARYGAGDAFFQLAPWRPAGGRLRSRHSIQQKRPPQGPAPRPAASPRPAAVVGVPVPPRPTLIDHLQARVTTRGRDFADRATTTHIWATLSLLYCIGRPRAAGCRFGRPPSRPLKGARQTCVGPRSHRYVSTFRAAWRGARASRTLGSGAAGG